MDAMNLPDKADQTALLKTPMEGDQLFSGNLAFNIMASGDSFEHTVPTPCHWCYIPPLDRYFWTDDLTAYL